MGCAKPVLYKVAGKTGDYVWTYRRALKWDGKKWDWAGDGTYDSEHADLLPLAFVAKGNKWADGKQVEPLLVRGTCFPCFDTRLLTNNYGGLYSIEALPGSYGLYLPDGPPFVLIELWLWTESGWCRQAYIENWTSKGGVGVGQTDLPFPDAPTAEPPPWPAGTTVEPPDTASESSTTKWGRVLAFGALVAAAVVFWPQERSLQANPTPPKSRGTVRYFSTILSGLLTQYDRRQIASEMKRRQSPNFNRLPLLLGAAQRAEAQVEGGMDDDSPEALAAYLAALRKAFIYERGRFALSPLRKLEKQILDYVQTGRAPRYPVEKELAP